MARLPVFSMIRHFIYMLYLIVRRTYDNTILFEAMSIYFVSIFTHGTK